MIKDYFYTLTWRIDTCFQYLLYSIANNFFCFLSTMPLNCQTENKVIIVLSYKRFRIISQYLALACIVQMRHFCQLFGNFDPLVYSIDAKICNQKDLKQDKIPFSKRNLQNIWCFNDLTSGHFFISLNPQMLFDKCVKSVKCKVAANQHWYRSGFIV